MVREVVIKKGKSPGGSATIALALGPWLCVSYFHKICLLQDNGYLICSVAKSITDCKS